MQFSAVFKMLCKEAGVTQKQALADMRMGRNATQRWIEGWPSFDTLSKISAYFSVPIETLSDCMIEEDEYVLSLFRSGIREESGNEKKPAIQMDDELRGLGYEKLTPVNQEMVRSLIAALIKSQSES